MDDLFEQTGTDPHFTPTSKIPAGHSRSASVRAQPQQLFLGAGSQTDTDDKSLELMLRLGLIGFDNFDT